MKHVSQNSKTALVALLLFIAVGVSASPFYPRGKGQIHQPKNFAQSRDTIAPRTNDTHEIDIQINIDSIMKTVQASLAAIDFNKIQQDVNASLASINWNEINKSIQTSLNSIDWDKMKLDVSKSLDEAKTSIAKIDAKKMQAEMDKLKIELNSKQFKENISNTNIQKQIQQSLVNAQKELLKAQRELDNYNAFINALQNDGLIKANQPYKIELKNGELYINGAKQSKAVTEKYRRFYEGKTNFLLNNDSENTTEKDNNSVDL